MSQSLVYGTFEPSEISTLPTTPEKMSDPRDDESPDDDAAIVAAAEIYAKGVQSDGPDEIATELRRDTGGGHSRRSSLSIAASVATRRSSIVASNVVSAYKRRSSVIDISIGMPPFKVTCIVINYISAGYVLLPWGEIRSVLLVFELLASPVYCLLTLSRAFLLRNIT
jgi:hypothetical protein